VRKITEPTARVLDAIRWLTVKRDGWLTATEIAQRTGQSPQGAGAVLASAVRKGLVQRVNRPSHKTYFALTSKGWDMATPRTVQAGAVTLARSWDADVCGGAALDWYDTGDGPRCPHCMASAAQLRVPDDCPAVPAHR